MEPLITAPANLPQRRDKKKVVAVGLFLVLVIGGALWWKILQSDDLGETLVRTRDVPETSTMGQVPNTGDELQLVSDYSKPRRQLTQQPQSQGQAQPTSTAASSRS